MKARTVAAAVAVLAGVALLAGCGGASAPAAPRTVTVTAPAPAGPVAAPAPVQAAPSTVTVPEVKGQNGAIAEDALKQAGFTNIRMAADAASGKQTVLLPENWTVTKVEPAAGTAVAPGQLIVLTMTK